MLNLTLRQMRTLVAISQTGRISLAARIVGLTAPAVTLQLQQAEIEAGLLLFDRRPDGLRATVAGRTTVEAAKSVLGRLRSLEEELAAISNGKIGTLKLGAVSTAKYFAPRLIAGFQKLHPGMEVELFVGNREETVAALRHQTIDIALMGRPPRDFAVEASLFGDHPLVIIAPPDHPLAGRKDISKEDVSQERFLVREVGSGTRTSLEIFFADIPERMESPGVEMGSNETIKQAVMAGLGIAFISAHTIEQELQLNRLVILDVVGMPIRRNWFSVSRADRTPSPAMGLFRGYLAQAGPQYLPLIPNIYPQEQATAVLARD